MEELYEKEEVILDNGDGLLDAGNLTRCKDAVCFICISSVDGMKRATGFFASICINNTEHKVIITNNHVMDNPLDAANAVARFHYEGNSEGAEAKFRPDLLFITNKVLDYTIIGCDHKVITSTYCIEPVKFDYEEDILVGDDIFVFQHPKGETKKISYQQVSKIEKPFIFYNADTDIGSSGSLVTRKFKLIALHSKGSDALRYNKGTLCSEILNHLNYGTYTEPKSVAESAEKRPSDSVIGMSAPSPKRPCLCLNDSLSPTELSPSKINTKKILFPDIPTTLPSEDLLEDLSKDIAGYWKHLGRKLKVPNSKLEKIHKDHFNYDDIAEKAFAMLMEWKESNVGNTLKDLYNTLVGYGKADTARRHFIVSD